MKKFCQFGIAISLVFVCWQSANIALAIYKHNYSDAVTQSLLLILWGGYLLFTINWYAMNRADEITEKEVQSISKDTESLINDMLQRFELPGRAIVNIHKRKKS
jgi:hypothetical protein